MSQSKKGRLKRCRSWEEVKFVHDIEPEKLAREMNKLSRRGWLVDYESQVPEPEPHNPQRYTIKATRDWCLCGVEEEIDEDEE